MESSSTFTRISGPIPEVKKNLYWSMIEKILHIRENLSKARSWETSLVCFKYSWKVSGVSQFQENLSNFHRQLSLGTVFPALKLIQNCYINMSI